MENNNNNLQKPNNQRFQRQPQAGAQVRPQNGVKQQGNYAAKKTFKPKSDIEFDVLRGERITKVTTGGKTLRFRTIAFAGDKKGKVGFALAKARQQNIARDKAKKKAARASNLIAIPINKTGSIPHEIIGKYGACSVFLKPAPEGTGIIAGGTVRKIVALAGIRNIYSKIYGSRTKINVVKATIDALNHLTTASQVAKARGITVEQVYRDVPNNKK